MKNYEWRCFRQKYEKEGQSARNGAITKKILGFEWQQDPVDWRGLAVGGYLSRFFLMGWSIGSQIATRLPARTKRGKYSSKA